jgi:hypothetical protein
VLFHIASSRDANQEESIPSIGERVNVQFRVEATNVLNHTNFDQIGTLFLFDPIHLGQVMSARDPRIIRLGLKVVF